jgi:DnaJ-class molecular chaperone
VGYTKRDKFPSGYTYYGCTYCGGSGEGPELDFISVGSGEGDCSLCHGLGYITCHTCNGTGYVNA